MADKNIKITQVKSIADTLENHKRTIKALGLGRPHYSVIKKDSPQIRGMIQKVIHLIRVEDVK